jgi:hypothetical protein
MHHPPQPPLTNTLPLHAAILWRHRPQHITVDKLPAGQGFSLSADPDLPPAASLSWGAHVGPQDSRHLPVTWQPQEAGPLTELLCFKLDGKHRLQVGGWVADQQVVVAMEWGLGVGEDTLVWHRTSCQRQAPSRQQQDPISQLSQCLPGQHSSSGRPATIACRQHQL